MHVYNHDILTSAIASAMATVISYLGYSLMYFGGGSRDDRDSSGGLGLIGALLSVILAPIAASLIPDGHLPHPPSTTPMKTAACLPAIPRPWLPH